MPFNPPSDASPIVKVFAEYLQAISQMDVDKALTFCDESFEAQILPSAMGVPKLGKAEFRTVFNTTVVNDFDVGADLNVFEVLEHGDNALTAHVDSTGVSKLGTLWHNEYVFFAHFTVGDSPKITKLKEFVDSAFVTSFSAEQAKKKAELARQ